MKRILIAITLLALTVVASTAQKHDKPWQEWSKKDAEKILNDSPWGQTQTETDVSEMFYTPTTQAGRGTSTSRQTQGATNQPVNVNFRIRFFTAQPIRQAFARLMILNQPNLDKQTIERLTTFTNLRSDQWIIVAVGYDATDQRFSGPVMQAFGSATTETLKNDSYLERKDGTKNFLNEYVPPGKDGFGARFIFPRKVDGQPFLTVDSGEVRFISEYSTSTNKLKLNMRFKLADMMANGQLEY
jgi:hypothetical protein